MSHTCIVTAREVLSLLEFSGIGGRGYTYQERDPAKHRDAHYIRVSGIANVAELARLLRPYSVTKREHWRIALVYAELRIAANGGLDAKGHLRRGGVPGRKPYSPEELALVDELNNLNRRGPRSPQPRGRICLTTP